MNVEATVQRLADGFVARDIMTPASDWRGADSEAAATRQLETQPQYDVIPIIQDEQVTAFLERGTSAATAITSAHLVSAETPLLDVIDDLCVRPFAFVLGRRNVVGMIHFSDLNDPLVKLPFFALLEDVERRLGRALRPIVSDETMDDVIKDPARRATLRGRLQAARKRSADRHLIDFLSFAEILQLAAHHGVTSLSADEIPRLNRVRNSVAHAVGDPLIGSHPDVQSLNDVRQICRRIFSEELTIGGSSR